jgi:hypothetical protein
LNGVVGVQPRSNLQADQTGAAFPGLAV